jgi:hypothetical protein
VFPLVTCNALLISASSWLRGVLNSRHTLRLFQNAVTLTPGTILSDLIECDFMGYVPYDLTGQIPNPIKQQDGQYTIAFTTPLFGCEGGSQTVFGAYIDDGVNLKFIQNFNPSLTVSVGYSFVVPVSISCWSTSILC